MKLEWNLDLHRICVALSPLAHPPHGQESLTDITTQSTISASPKNQAKMPLANIDFSACSGPDQGLVPRRFDIDRAPMSMLSVWLLGCLARGSPRLQSGAHGQMWRELTSFLARLNSQCFPVPRKPRSSRSQVSRLALVDPDKYPPIDSREVHFCRPQL